MKPLSQKEFNLIYSKVPRFCVELVIKNPKGVLLSLRTIPPVGVWHLPGGTLGKNESVEEAIKRVAKEELGVNVKIRKLLGIIDWFKDPLLPNQHSVSVVYLVEISSGKVKLNNEASEYGFFRDIPLNTVQKHTAFIKQFIIE